MKTSRRPLLDPIINPQGGTTYVRNLETRVQRIERAKVKFNLIPDPPKKAPQSDPAPQTPAVTYTYFALAAWFNADPATISDGYSIVDQENDSDYNIASVAVADKDTDLAVTHKGNSGSGFLSGDDSWMLNTWEIAYTGLGGGSGSVAISFSLNDEDLIFVFSTNSNNTPVYPTIAGFTRIMGLDSDDSDGETVALFRSGDAVMIADQDVEYESGFENPMTSAATLGEESVTFTMDVGDDPRWAILVKVSS